MSQLTQEQLDRQDFVDNAILDLLSTVSDSLFKWDTESMGKIRDVIWETVKCATTLTAQEFYPFVVEDPANTRKIDDLAGLIEEWDGDGIILTGEDVHTRMAEGILTHLGLIQSKEE